MVSGGIDNGRRLLPLAYAHGTSLYTSVTIHAIIYLSPSSERLALHACNQLAAGKRIRSGPPRCGSRETHIERLNRAVPDDVRSQPRRRAADDDVIVYRDALRPQHPAVVRALVGMVFKRNGGWAIRRVRAHVARMSLVPLPVGRDDAIALGGDLCSITRRRRRAVDSLIARRLHPSTVACWTGGALDRKVR
jgi:hypothetical protein